MGRFKIISSMCIVSTEHSQQSVEATRAGFNSVATSARANTASYVPPIAIRRMTAPTGARRPPGSFGSLMGPRAIIDDDWTRLRRARTATPCTGACEEQNSKLFQAQSSVKKLSSNCVPSVLLLGRPSTCCAASPPKPASQSSKLESSIGSCPLISAPSV